MFVDVECINNALHNPKIHTREFTTWCWYICLVFQQIINGKYVEGFYIYARQLDSATESYKMLTVLNGGGASTCTVTALMKYTLYEFFIVPFYKTVEGKPSNSRISRTMEDGEYFQCYISYFYVCLLAYTRCVLILFHFCTNSFTLHIPCEFAEFLLFTC